MPPIPPAPEDFTVQPDGRRVAGPDLSKEKGQSGFGLPVVAVALMGLLALVGGFSLGRGSAPTPAWQDLYGQRIQEGCLPQVLVVGVGKQSEVDRLDSAVKYAASGISHTYADAKHVQTHLVQVTGALKDKSPGAEEVAYVTLERCLA